MTSSTDPQVRPLDPSAPVGLAPDTMRAVVQRRFGGPEVLQVEEAPAPAPGEGQVRVAVGAAGVHLVDTTIREGAAWAGGVAELPMTPGREVAGTVDRLGPGVDPWWAGRRVVAHLGFANGGYASHAIAPVGALIPLADHVGFPEAVAMVGTGRTTLGILEVAEVRRGDVALVTAAAGGIGVLALQAARRAGALAVGVAGGPEKVAVARAVGADVAVDYRVEGWADRVAEALGDRRVTVALDGVGGAIGRQAFELVAPGGRLVLYGNASSEHVPLATADLFASGVTVSAAIGPRMVQRPGGIQGLAERAVEELAAGHLVPRIHPPFPLERAARAHEAIAGRGTTGKVVLVP